MPTRILIVGSGGREHALAWKLAHEPGVNDVIVAPGSDGIAAEPRVTVVPGVDPLDGAAVVALARAHAAELTVIGPEAPLAAGVADALAAAGIAVFGPIRAAARIESSKAFCREVADAAGVPMARGRAFSTAAAGRSAALELFERDGAVVIKADGLAAGKGVTVCDDRATLEAALSRDGPVVVEERLVGREASVMALCDGVDAVALPVSRDHKRLADGDHGPMTGGMGAYSPLADVPDAAADDLLDRFHRPVLRELARRGATFRGALYAGLMLTSAGPRLLEFNARLGDPETQVILPRLAVALGPMLLAAARGRPASSGTQLPTFPGAAVGVVLASQGYPDLPRRGDRIEGLADALAGGAVVFHSGTRRDQDGSWRTNGGRVLTVVGRGHDTEAARAAADAAAGRISFAGAQRRHDIGVQPAPVTA
ncbi:MAG: phosphoribosylamine--glycine ligase [Chloroflexi bacterium]|nr:phosphoribosylamine--glycine ligase [Chloroflexota bacterium]